MDRFPSCRILPIPMHPSCFRREKRLVFVRNRNRSGMPNALNHTRDASRKSEVTTKIWLFAWKTLSYSWWLSWTNPFENMRKSNWIISPSRVENKEDLKPPTSLTYRPYQRKWNNVGIYISMLQVTNTTLNLLRLSQDFWINSINVTQIVGIYLQGFSGFYTIHPRLSELVGRISSINSSSQQKLSVFVGGKKSLLRCAKLIQVL